MSTRTNEARSEKKIRSSQRKYNAQIMHNNLRESLLECQSFKDLIRTKRQYIEYNRDNYESVIT